MQSNGLLFTPEIGDLSARVRPAIGMGISLDGPPEVNDRHRVDHAGNPSSARLEERLELLRSPRYRSLFSGFLCVIDPQTDPVRVTDYLLSFDPPGFDYLLPHYNWVNPPPGKERRPAGHPLWRLAGSGLRSLVRRLRRRRASAISTPSSRGCSASPRAWNAIGTGAVDLIVVETNGDIEAVDSLKATYRRRDSPGV